MMENNQPSKVKKTQMRTSNIGLRNSGGRSEVQLNQDGHKWVTVISSERI